MTILLHELVGRDAAHPFSPHCWKAVTAIADKGLGMASAARSHQHQHEI